MCGLVSGSVCGLVSVWVGEWECVCGWGSVCTMLSTLDTSTSLVMVISHTTLAIVRQQAADQPHSKNDSLTVVAKQQPQNSISSLPECVG